jgi:hypothetical protein
MLIATENSTVATVINDTKASLISKLATHARDYFPQLEERDLAVRLIRQSGRTYSVLHEFEVSDGTRSHGVIVKIPFLPLVTGEAVEDVIASQRPRLFGLIEPEQMAELEFAALTAVEQHFEDLNDPRFGTIRPLDLFRNPDSVVMEKNRGDSFRSIHLAARRIKLGRNRIPFSPKEATQHAGAWLREFHRMAPLPQTSKRMTTRDDFLEALAAQTGNLIDQGESKTLLRSIRSQFEIRARRALDAQFELATGHGDFAPRNLLIGAGNKVTAIDTLARWNSPIYEDLAMFLLGLRASAAQVVSLGAAYDRKALHRLETQFLESYFDGASIPLKSIRLFEGLVLLDRWGAFAQRARLARGTKRRVYETWRLVTLRRFLSRFFRQTFHEIDQLGSIGQ